MFFLYIWRAEASGHFVFAWIEKCYQLQDIRGTRIREKLMLEMSSIWKVAVESAGGLWSMPAVEVVDPVKLIPVDGSVEIVVEKRD